MTKNITWFALVFILGACNEGSFEKPKYPANERPTLHTTISADGQMVAALLHAGTDRQELKIRNLATDTQWRHIKAPSVTTTVRFANKGHDLLLTYRDLPGQYDVLARWDMDKPLSDPIKLYEGPELGFPVEVSPRNVMVRTRAIKPSNDSSKQFYLSGYHWILVSPNQQVQEVGPKPVLPYSTPNIVKDGFFWVEEQMGETKDEHPLILSYALPGGVAPMIDRKRFGKYTHTVNCDEKGSRCLRRHIKNFNQRPAENFVYGVDASTTLDQCNIPELDGFSDGISITPTGEAAIMSLATGYDKPRHIVIMQFNTRQCAPTNIQHFNFEEN